MKRITRMALAIALLLFATAGFALTTSAPASAHEPGTNGCNKIPDQTPLYDFHDVCDWHDLCYGNHYFGEGEAGRQGCDDTWQHMMFGWCSNRWAEWYQVTVRSDCYNAAEVFYGAVRLKGAPYFDNTESAMNAN